MSVTVGVLGVTEAHVGETPLDLGTPKQRALLAALALHRGRPVSVGALEEMLWGDEPPAAVAASLQAYVSGLRKAIEPDRPPRTPARVVVTAVPGYALQLPVEAVDAERFADVVSTVRRGLNSDTETFDGALLPPLHSVTLAQDRAQLESVLTLWRGEPFTDLADAASAAAERARLADLRLVALLEVAAIRLAQGEHAALASDLTALRHEYPLHEGITVRQVIAEYRCGRQADALGTLRAVRSELSEALGVDPSPAVQALELAVLRQDRALDWRPPLESIEVAVDPRPMPASSVEPPSAQLRDPRHWPVVGRERELGQLAGLLDTVVSGLTQFALLVGEPGIGKSRLVQELLALAGNCGFLTLAGRCSEDEGAPPLWPWRSILTDLHEQASSEQWSTWVTPHADQLADLVPPGAIAARPGVTIPNAESEAERRFRVWDAVTRVLVAAAQDQPVVLVMDDLHWADASSLRLLRHLVQSVPDTRLLVASTRRANPEPQGALAEVGEAIARRHGLRMDLDGLPAEDVLLLVRAATGATPSQEVAESLRDRTDGNPFFVVELARWESESSSGAEVPAAVTDVVSRRVEQLPTSTQHVIRSAAVLGRTFDLHVLSEVDGEGEDELLDALDPALAAGLVFESRHRVGQFRFAHALVQESVYSGISAVRRARRHADAARALSAHPAEAAHHWLAAGPTHAGSAWRAASLAAESAERVFGHDEADRLLGAALASQRDDPLATAQERYELLMRRADACRWAADVVGLDACLNEAIEIAEGMGDYERMARAAVGMSEGLLWSVRDYGIVDEKILDTLNTVLRELPAGDGELRCRAMLALASESFYGDDPKRREALTDEGLAMARRLGDSRLLLWALQTAFVSRWRSRYAANRRELAEDALALAEQLGDATAEAMVRSLHAAVHQELGHIDTMRRDVARVREIAVPRRLAYPLLLTSWMEVPWLSMAGDLDGAEKLFAESLALNASTTIRQSPEVVFGALFSMRYWQGRCDELLPQVEELRESRMLVMDLMHVFLLVELGRLDEAHVVADEMGLDASFPVPDDWLTIVTLYQLARIAAGFGDRDECARLYGLMSPYAGRVVSAGSAAALGSVEAVLGLLAAISGELDLARQHADRGVAQYAEWGVPLAAAELERWRAAHHF